MDTIIFPNMANKIVQRQVNYKVFQVGFNWSSSDVSLGDQKSLRRRIILFALLRTWWALRSLCLASLYAFCACRNKTFNSSRVAESSRPLLSNLSIRFTISAAHSITWSASRWYSITRYCNSSILRLWFRSLLHKSSRVAVIPISDCTKIRWKEMNGTIAAALDFSERTLISFQSCSAFICQISCLSFSFQRNSIKTKSFISYFLE